MCYLFSMWHGLMILGMCYLLVGMFNSYRDVISQCDQKLQW
jgi:hypothetical protein